jgi:hypothetical protein
MENSTATTKEAPRFAIVAPSYFDPQLTFTPDTALAFSLRFNSPLARSAFEKWRKMHSIHTNLETVAAFHHSKYLLRRVLLAWRIELRNKHKSMTKARAVDKFLVVRSAWTVLRAKFAERRREYTLKALELRKTRSIFYGMEYFLSMRHL